MRSNGFAILLLSAVFVVNAELCLGVGDTHINYAVDFVWSQLPSADLRGPGAKTVTLAACPPGVKGNEPEYWIYISGKGTDEAVKVTGGSCAGNGQPGTLQFNATNDHPAGYTIGSASGGLQEALIAARFVPTNPAGVPQGGKVIVPPVELRAYARVSLRSSNLTVDFSGSIIECHMNDTCLFVGDPRNSTAFDNITLINPRGRPMVVKGVKPFIEVNAQKTRVINVATRVPPAGATFGTYVQVDDDQAFLLAVWKPVLDTESAAMRLSADPTLPLPAPLTNGPPSAGSRTWTSLPSATAMGLTGKAATASVSRTA